MKTSTVQELKRQCSKAGLLVSSKMANLLACLKNYQTSTEVPKFKDVPVSADTHCLVATSIPLDTADLIEMAREELQKAAQNDPLYEEYVSADTPVVTNAQYKNTMALTKSHRTNGGF